MQPQSIQKYLRIYRDGLLKDNIPFWQDHAPDRKCGGFFTMLDERGSVYGTDKPVWIMGRITWLFARLYNAVAKRPEWLKLAAHGIDFLEKHCFDDDGRMFFLVSRDGKPLRKRRYLFSETFCAIAFAEYAKAAGDDRYRLKAENLYRLILRYHRTPGLLRPKTLLESRRLKSHAMPMILMATAQVLRQNGENIIYTGALNDSLNQIEHHFLNNKFKALLENVGPEGEFLDEPEGRLINPGHAIESSWFIMEEARYREDKTLLSLALKILDWSLEWGWDKKIRRDYLLPRLPRQAVRAV
jgi:N-acylglucosamine 2-epimerase